MFGSRTLIATAMQQREFRSLVSNESEDTSGRTSAEIERVIYARVTSFDFLERASGAERQEQWSVKVGKTEENAGSGSIRVRKVTNLREPGAAIQYILTSKLDVGTKGHSAETSEQSSLDQFNIFKYMANKGMLKDRYTFPIEGSDLMWEVDCFPKPGEMYFEWVKIDLEKWPSNKELPQLPFAVAEMMDGDKSNQSEETKAKISRLYEDVFLLKNTNEPLADYAEPENEQPEVAADPEHTPGAGSDDNPEGEDDASKQSGSSSGSDDGNGTDAGAGDQKVPGAGDGNDSGQNGNGGSQGSEGSGDDDSKGSSGDDDDAGKNEGSN